MNEREVDVALALDREWLQALRVAWLELADCAVFGDVASSRLGATSKLRRRVLEVGERTRALGADRAWIPHPRERLKNALAAALTLRESLAELDRALGAVDRGDDSARLARQVEAFVVLVDRALPASENRWAALLDSQYREGDTCKDAAAAGPDMQGRKG